MGCVCECWGEGGVKWLEWLIQSRKAKHITNNCLLFVLEAVIDCGASVQREGGRYKKKRG